ncbi:class I SAM-dependent methyltransferase [Neorhodopirellula pilleata]|nr:class I SAM-dependent methyltransferase [Neorhodopirellula pilleata]
MENAFDAKDYWESRLTENFNLRGVGDIGLPNSYNKCLYSIRRFAFRLATKNLKGLEKPSVLDVGSGTGFYIQQWLEHGAEALNGSDLTSTAVENLQAQFPAAKFRQMDISATLPEGIGTYDAVSCFDVLFHIVDDQKYNAAIANIASLIKSGGYFFYSDNFLKSETRITHQSGRTEQTIVNELEKNGLQIVRRLPMFVLMNDPVRSDSRPLRKAFSLTYRLASRGEEWGKLVGNVLMPIERCLIRCKTRGPSTEIMVCHKA